MSDAKPKSDCELHAEWLAKVKAAKTAPTRYRAVVEGYDNETGRLVLAGEEFVTTQPQGSWMEKVEEDEKPARSPRKTQDAL